MKKLKSIILTVGVEIGFVAWIKPRNGFRELVGAVRKQEPP